MTQTWVLVLVFASWVTIGVVLALVLGRRGHDAGVWFLLGAMLGPFAIALAVNAWRHAEAPDPEIIASATRSANAHGVDVLVGFDGSPEASAAVAGVVDLFGDRLGRLTLLTAIPFDGGLIDEQLAREELERGGERYAWLAPGLAIVHGDPTQVLIEAVRDGGYDLLGVGTTGTGHAHLFGSVAKQLAESSKVPVLLAGRPV